MRGIKQSRSRWYWKRVNFGGGGESNSAARRPICHHSIVINRFYKLKSFSVAKIWRVKKKKWGSLQPTLFQKNITHVLDNPADESARRGCVECVVMSMCLEGLTLACGYMFRFLYTAAHNTELFNKVKNKFCFSQSRHFPLRCVAMARLPFGTGSDKPCEVAGHEVTA